MFSLSLKNIFQSRDKVKIGIIDSGLGGITFSSNLKEKVNDLDVTLYIDNDGFPYGNKDILWLKERLEMLVSKAKPNILIVACNTLSSVIFHYDLKFNKMVVDVITPTIYFLKRKKYKNICILATKNTIKMDLYGKLLGSEVMYLDATKLINDIQNDFNYTASLFEIIEDIDSCADMLLLGCTHLIKIKDEFRRYLEIDVVSQDEIFASIFNQ